MYACICCGTPLLTHWGRDKMTAIFQTTFSNGFSWMKMYEFRLTFHWSLFPGVQLTIFQHWFRKWLGADQATSHYLNQWWLDYRRIYASLGLNELRPPKMVAFQIWWPVLRGKTNMFFIEQCIEMDLQPNQQATFWKMMLLTFHNFHEYHDWQMSQPDLSQIP